MGFKGGGLERFGQALKAGLFDRGSGRVAHGKALDKRKTASTKAAVVAEIGDTTFYLGWLLLRF
jgi:hypothetical protein